VYPLALLMIDEQVYSPINGSMRRLRSSGFWANVRLGV